jgi:hypothetical protein
MDQQRDGIADDSAAETAEKPRADAGRFQKGNPGYGLRRTAAKKDQANPVPALLRAMRAVTTRPASKDRTQLQRECREWLRSDRKGFLTKLADLEKAGLAGRARAIAAPRIPEPEAVDEGHARCEALIEQVLAQCKREPKESLAKDGRCITCGRPLATGAGM